MSEPEMKVGLNGTNVFGMPFFGFPKIALPGVIGELAEQGVARAQQGCEKVKIASEEMAEALRETYSSNARNVTEYGLKVFDISNANTASAIDFCVVLLGGKSVTDVFTLTVEQARKASDTASVQNKELWGLAAKLAAETSEPIKKHFTKVVRHQAS